MKAFVIHRYGKNEVGQIADMPEPALRDDDVLVQIHAASVNVLDIRIRSGALKPILRYRLPLILGNDMAGTVVRVGPRVRRFQPGDAVYARPDQERIGTFAQFIAVREDDVAPKPRNLSMAQAASIPLVGLTAWQALVEIAQLKAGQKVFIHAGSGGVGTIAIQLARHLGAHVATTTSTANVDAVKALGADVVAVDGDDLADRVAGATGNAAIRLGIEAIGGAANMTTSTAAIAAVMAQKIRRWGAKRRPDRAESVRASTSAPTTSAT